MAALPPTSSRHRLPTFSASQALKQASNSRISTGSDALNKALGSGGDGIARGQITEICGPPGSGKTALAMQIAANAILDGDKVVWIDTSNPLPLNRFLDFLSEDPLPLLSSLRVLRVSSLAHLLAFVIHPLPSFPPEKTALIVIDNVSTVFATAFPPGMDDYSKNNGSGSGYGKGKGGKISGSARRFPIMGDLVAGLGRIAATRGLSVLVLNQMTTRVISGVGAVLTPAIGSPTWTTPIPTRLLLYRNRLPRRHSPKPTPSSSSPASPPINSSNVRFLTILKHSGTSYEESAGPVIMFRIEKKGIKDIPIPSNTEPPPLVQVLPPVRKKRKRGLEAGVVPGSDEEDESDLEDYGWESGLEDEGLGVVGQETVVASGEIVAVGSGLSVGIVDEGR